MAAVIRRKRPSEFESPVTTDRSVKSRNEAEGSSPSTLESTSVSSVSGGECSTCTGGSASGEPSAKIFNVKSRYNHFENALVFARLAYKLLRSAQAAAHERRLASLGSDGRSSLEGPSIFLAGPDDPSCAKLSAFAERLAAAFRCKYPCYVLALIYLQRVADRRGLCLTPENFQRLVCGSIVVAAKFYDDLYYSNEHYAKELGFALDVLNSLEAKLLILLDFSLVVSPCQFQPVMNAFDFARSQVCQDENLPVLCGLATAHFPREVLTQFEHLYTPKTHAVCGAGVLVATAATGLCPPKLQSPIYSYLSSREAQGCRYDAEEENLMKAAVHSRSKIQQRLWHQWHENAVKKI